MPSWKLFNKQSRQGYRHLDDDEKSPLLKDENSTRRLGWTLPLTRQKMITEKQQAKKSKCSVRIDLISSPIPRTGRKHLTILSLEDSILSNIHQRLSLVDGACLSLSCKRLFSLFETTLKRKEFNFPRLLQLRVPILCVNSRKVPRNQLLLRLESDHWAYCGKCLKLHPREEFSEDSLQYPNLGRSCTKYAGIVDICPCAAWTIRERGRIVKSLKSLADTTLSHAQIGPFKFDRTGGPHLSHSCSFVTTPESNAQVAMRVFIDKSDRLVVHARYTLRSSISYVYAFPEPIFQCPHVNLTGLNYGNSVCITCPHCPQCWSLVDKRQTLSGGEKKVVYNVTRDLGSCEWPADFRWLSNCRLTGDKFMQTLLYWVSSWQLHREICGKYYGWAREYELDQWLQREEYTGVPRRQQRLLREAYQRLETSSYAEDITGTCMAATSRVAVAGRL